MNAPVDLRALQSLDPAVLAGLETPCYLFDPGTVMADLQELRERLGTGVVVSVKASPVLDLLVRCNPAFGDGIEIASMGELNLTIGRLSVPRFVNTPALDATLVAAALACKATLVADSPAQVAMIESAARKPAAQGRAPLGLLLRVNAASLLGRGGPAADHFGMDLATLRAELARLAAAGDAVKVIGLHVFAGSLSFATQAAELVQRLAGLVGELRGTAPLELALVGAGLPPDWRESGLDFTAYRRALGDLQGQVRVLHEAGRAVFSRAGSFMTRVVGSKDLQGESVLVCDGGMAHCFALAQTEQFVRRRREPQLLRATTPDAPLRSHTVVGNSCNRADVIGQLQAPGTPAPGDLLLFEHCGAYHSYSPTGFLNLRPARRYIAS
jgi:diaminopimelate decarboxylase